MSYIPFIHKIIKEKDDSFVPLTIHVEYGQHVPVIKEDEPTKSDPVIIEIL